MGKQIVFIFDTFITKTYLTFFAVYCLWWGALEARDIIAIIVVVGTFIALVLKALSTEQAISILMFILGYYFGYKYGYDRGVSHAAGKSGK